MSKRDEVALSGDALPESAVLGLLADALLGRVEELVSERVEALAAEAAPQQGAGWLRVSEVAARVGSCERTVYRALRSGRLAGERLGVRWRIRPEAVAAWLAAPSDPRPPRSAPAFGPQRQQLAPVRPGGRAVSFSTRARARTRPRGAGGRSSTIEGDGPQEVK